ncbi:unnamed protein product, partial [Discosporangium mesarthrocarpum]
RCLKLYCDCFSYSRYCGPSCKCSVCFNTPDKEESLQEARRSTLDRNPLAFKRKLAAAMRTKGDSVPSTYSTSCSCKKSACLKK